MCRERWHLPRDLDPRKAAVWEDWKRKMPGIPARFIDALMLHGELRRPNCDSTRSALKGA